MRTLLADYRGQRREPWTTAAGHQRHVPPCAICPLRLVVTSTTVRHRKCGSNWSSADAAGRRPAGNAQLGVHTVHIIESESNGGAFMKTTNLDDVTATQISEVRYLVILMVPQARCAGVLRLPLDEFRDQDRLFRQFGATDMNGFNDWLRQDDGEVIGLRYWPIGEAQEYVRMNDRFVHSMDNKRESIIFTFVPQRDWDESKSADQDFGDNSVFRSDDGMFAFTVRLPDGFEDVKRQFVR